MTPLSPNARALLARTSKNYEPNAADRDRLRRALTARVGLGAATAAATAASTSVATNAAAAPAIAPSATIAGASVAAKSGAGIAAKLVASMVLVASVGATSVVLTQRDQRGSNANASANGDANAATPSTAQGAAVARGVPVPQPSEPTVVDVPSVPGAASPLSKTTLSTPFASSLPPAPDAPARPMKAVVAPPTATEEDPLTTEISLLRTAQAALRNHEGARALEALDSHARRFPTGVLAEERAAARVFALCDLGRESEAATAKASFLSLHPSSPAAERVRKACGTTNE